MFLWKIENYFSELVDKVFYFIDVLKVLFLVGVEKGFYWYFVYNGLCVMINVIYCLMLWEELGLDIDIVLMFDLLKFLYMLFVLKFRIWNNMFDFKNELRLKLIEMFYFKFKIMVVLFVFDKIFEI